MRRILVENARRKRSLKRGGDRHRLDLSLERPLDMERSAPLLALDEALNRFEARDPGKAQLVKRRGELPTLREYVERYTALDEDIRDFFPALLMMEDLGESSGGTTGSLAVDNGAAVGAQLERLGDYRILREIGRGGIADDQPPTAGR
jgi:hypothetical protein